MAEVGKLEEAEEKLQPVPHRLITTKTTRLLELGEWRVSTSKKPISNSKEIDEMSDKLTIPVPEMIFGNNFVCVENQSKDIHLAWRTFDALDAVDKNGTDLKVSYSDAWNKTRDDVSEEIKHVSRPFDWTYSSSYRGSTPCTSNETGHRRPQWCQTEETLPLELLKRQDPILFYDEVILYESELDDNGTSVFTVRVRVMPERLLILARFSMRLDNVVFRVRDTRLYIEFATGKIIREYLVREEKYETVKAAIKPYQMDDMGALLNDANWVAQHCPIVDGSLDMLSTA